MHVVVPAECRVVPLARKRSVSLPIVPSVFHLWYQTVSWFVCPAALWLLLFICALVDGIRNRHENSRARSDGPVHAVYYAHEPNLLILFAARSIGMLK